MCEGDAADASRSIGGWGSYTIVAGSMVGVGIFLAPPAMAGHISSAPLFLSIWLLGGFVALAGAVACAELGTMFPRSGGDFVFQLEAFGPSVAFASGWVLFGAIFAGSIATLAVALCEFQVSTVFGIDTRAAALSVGGFEVSRAQLLAVGVVLLFTVLNMKGSGESALVQTILTMVPIAAFLALSVAVLAKGAISPEADGSPAAKPLTAHGLAFSYDAVYFAFSGWINVIYVAGEVRKPERNVPLGLIGGTLSVTVLYLIVCLALVRGLGIEELSRAGEAGSLMASLVFGEGGRTAMAVMIGLALLASINATVLGGPRILRAMAEAGAASARTADPADRPTPRKALLIQAGWALALILSGGFNQLMEMLSIAMVLTGSLTVASMFQLRRTRPSLPRPYRATFYPYLPALYLLASATIILLTLFSSLTSGGARLHPLLGLGLLVGAFVYHRLRLAR